MELHHMLKNNGGGYQLYLNKLKELSSILGQFGNSSQIIWLHQYPTIDPKHNEIYSEKIYRYNEDIRQILK